MLEGWAKIDTLEGEICRIADSVAYINHDIDDALRANVITELDLPASATAVLGHSHRERINRMVGDIIVQSWGVRSGTEKPAIVMSRPVLEAADTLREFLFRRGYNMHAAQEESEKARRTVRFLYEYYNNQQDALPPEYLRFSEEKERRVVDYIAGMTDRFAARQAEELAGR